MLAHHPRILGIVALLVVPSLVCLPARSDITVGGDPDQVTPADPATWTADTRAKVGIDSGKAGTLILTGGSGVVAEIGYLGYGAGSAGTVSIMDSGSNWTGYTLYVGYSGSGTLSVQDGGAISGFGCYLGLNAGSTGTTTITGSGSAVLDSPVFVGFSGAGSLRVENGGTLKSGSGYICWYPGSSGAVAVTGDGSTWTNQYSLTVGNAGPGLGRLTVENGGVVSTGSLNASACDLKGNGVINTKGAVVDMDLHFDAVHGLPQSFGTGGTLNVNLDSTSTLGLGYHGTGNVRIADGVTINCDTGSLGDGVGSTGTATVTGTGSAWNITEFLFVGRSGTGNLYVDSGGSVTSGLGYIGREIGSHGAVTVAPGSTWTNIGSIYVGYAGRNTGSLTVASGGTVNAGTILASATDLKGSGTINTHGLLADMDLLFDPTHGTDLAFGDGGRLNLILDNGSLLGVGYWRAGTLQISGGVTINSVVGYLGYNTGSSGAAVVTGAGTVWNSGNNLDVGTNGAGDLSVTGGAKLNSKGVILGHYTGSSGMAKVSGMDSSIACTALWVGYGGIGSLDIERGGSVTSSGNSYIGRSTGYWACVSVTGASSNWTAGSIYVGDSGNGTLGILSGGNVASTIGYVGDESGSNGTVLVDGTNSSWTISGTSGSNSLYAGYSGNGRVKVSNGGRISILSDTFLGYGTGASGKTTIAGSGSTLFNKGRLYVGLHGSGVLTIGAGGTASAWSANINSSSSMNLHVSGNDMLVLGTDTMPGTITNSGNVNISADAFLAAGTYLPITELKGRTIAWSGTGSYNAYGGTWNSTSHTFTVSAPVSVAGGTANTVISGERLLITDSATGRRVGASFGTVAGGTNFSAVPLGGTDLIGLPTDQCLLGAWNFTTNFAGDQALLSFDVGAGQSYDMSVWHYDGTAWMPFAAPDLTYGEDGIADFAVTSLGGGYALTAAAHDGDANYDNAVNVIDLGVLAKYYGTAADATWAMGDFNGDGAVNVVDLGVLAKNYDWSGAWAGAVPEPCSMALLALGGLGLLRRRSGYAR